MNNPLVTILTPTYNHERYIGEAIASAIAQTYTNWEMIILDDGSNDRTGEIARECAAQDSRIRYYHQENIGIFRLAESYNKGVALSQGDLIAILEGDDVWAPTKLEKQVEMMQSDREAVLCWSMANCVNFNRREIYYHSPLANDPERRLFDNNPAGSILNLFLFRNCIPALTIVIRRDALMKAGGFLQSFNLPLVDLPTLYALALTGRFIFIPEILGEWRTYAGQVTKTYPVAMTRGFYQLALQLFDSGNVQPGTLRFTRRDVDNYYKNRLIISYARSGRYRLIRKEFGEARKDYLQALSLYGFREPVWKLRALTGYLFSLFRMDVEGLARLLGRRSYGK